MRELYIGCDNGVTGTIGFISGTYSTMYKTPVKLEQSYTKKKQNISRVQVGALRGMIQGAMEDNDVTAQHTRVMIERPMVNPGRFKATLSAMRALEATLNVVELLGIGYEYCDSKEWQKALLPQGIKGEELKKASADIGKRLYPHLSSQIGKHKDADGLLISHFLMLKYK